MRLFCSTFFSAFLLLALGGCSVDSAGTGDWVLDRDYSSLTITSIKKGKVGEAHHFKSLTGSVSPSGEARVAITMASIESNIGIRNERMREFLFEDGKYPLANITARLNLQTYTGLTPGHRMKKELYFTVDLHGIQKRIKIPVFVTRLSKKAFAIASIKPVMVRAKDFQLTSGLKKLQELAGLPSIDTVAPTSFNLVFRKR